MDFVVFYSWQSDLPDKTNKRAIRNALREAAIKIEEELSDIELRIVLDEATRDEPGSPNIPSTILEKIKSSDAFVCDITTINNSVPEIQRKTPNPNVIFELGYAVAQLGWGRVVMLFNTEYGDFKKDLPFDFDRHRISRYKLVEEENVKGTNSASKKDLSILVLDALRAIIKNPTPKPILQCSLTSEEVKHQRDIVNLKWVMATLHIPTLDEFILETPGHIYGRALHFWESFNGVITNSLFHLYDNETFAVLKQLHNAWGNCTSHGENYHPAVNPNLYVFGNPGDAPLDRNQQKAWNTINAGRIKLREALNKLLTIIRERYLEIDTDEMNRAAWNEYIEFQKKMTDLLEDKYSN